MTPDDVIKAGRSFIGVKFIWQCRNPEIGLDCGGLLRAVLDRLNYKLGVDRVDYGRGGTSILRDLMRETLIEIPIEEARAGDFLLFLVRRTTYHCAIISQDAPQTWMIHADESRVTEVPLDRWGRFIVAAYRIEGLEV